MTRIVRWLSGSVILAASALLLPCTVPLLAAAQATSELQSFKMPPWSPRDSKQFDFTVQGVDNVPDLHGSPTNADLVVFAAGNQFMVMTDLMKAFQATHPDVHRIFYETLPPGIEAQQIDRGSLEIGNLIIDVKPDVYMSGLRRMKLEQKAGVISHYIAYATNHLAIEVLAGNPKHVRSLADLGRDDVRVSMPNPKWEGIGTQLIASFQKAGGDELVKKIMITKVAAGTTILTRIHHRETAINIATRVADAGPVWLSEALYQKRIANPIEMVAIPDVDNQTAVYTEAVVKDAPHPVAGQAFVDFVSSAAGAAIYKSYGFTPPAEGT